MHEHTGDCCGQHQHVVHEQLHHAVEHMGRLCCAGQCQHPEHQNFQAMIEQQMYHQLSETTSTEPAVEQKKSKKKKKRSASFLLDQLVAKAV